MVMRRGIVCRQNTRTLRSYTVRAPHHSFSLASICREHYALSAFLFVYSRRLTSYFVFGMVQARLASSNR